MFFNFTFQFLILFRSDSVDLGAHDLHSMIDVEGKIDANDAIDGGISGIAHHD